MAWLHRKSQGIFKTKIKQTRISEFSSVASYKINTQKSALFLCVIINEHMDTKVKNTIPKK